MARLVCFGLAYVLVCAFWSVELVAADSSPPPPQKEVLKKRRQPKQHKPDGLEEATIGDLDDFFWKSQNPAMPEIYRPTGAEDDKVYLEEFACQKHEGDVISSAFTPDGRYFVASTQGRLGNQTYDKSRATVRVWDTKTGKLVKQIPGLFYAAISPDGKTMATQEHEGPIKIVELGLTDPFTEPREITTINGPLRGIVQFLNDGSLLVNTLDGPQRIAVPSGEFEVLSASNGSAVGRALDLNDASSADGSLILTGQDQIDFTDAKSGRLIKSMLVDSRTMKFQLSPNKKFLAVMTNVGIAIMDTDRDRLIKWVGTDSNFAPGSLRFSPDGDILYWGDSSNQHGNDPSIQPQAILANRQLHQTDLRLGTDRTLAEFRGGVTSIAVSHDGKQTAVFGAQDGEACRFTVINTGPKSEPKKDTDNTFDSLWSDLTGPSPEKSRGAAQALREPKFQKALTEKLAAIGKSAEASEALVKQRLAGFYAKEPAERDAALKILKPLIADPEVKKYFLEKVDQWLAAVKRQSVPEAAVRSRVLKLKYAPEDFNSVPAGMVQLIRALSEDSANQPLIESLATDPLSPTSRYAQERLEAMRRMQAIAESRKKPLATANPFSPIWGVPKASESPSSE